MFTFPETVLLAIGVEGSSVAERCLWHIASRHENVTVAIRVPKYNGGQKKGKMSFFSYMRSASRIGRSTWNARHGTLRKDILIWPNLFPSSG
jgi:hypothetical protein